MRTISWIAIVVGLVGVVQAQAPKDKSNVSFKLSADEQAVFDLVNAERKKANLPQVKIDEKLTKSAREHSANMAKQNKLDHTLDNKGPADRVKAVGYKYSAIAENIATGQNTSTAVMQTWLNSTDHKKNILGSYAEFGIGTATDTKGQRYWTQVFATAATQP